MPARLRYPVVPPDLGNSGRLARWAPSEVYHRSLMPCGPLLRGSLPEADGLLRLGFDHARGLATRDGGPVRRLAITNSQRAWRWVESRIEGETLKDSDKDLHHGCSACAEMRMGKFAVAAVRSAVVTCAKMR